MSLFSKFVQLFQDDVPQQMPRPPINSFFNQQSLTDESEESCDEEEEEDQNQSDEMEDNSKDRNKEIDKSDDDSEDCESCKNKKTTRSEQQENEGKEMSYENWYQELIDERQLRQHQVQIQQQIQQVELYLYQITLQQLLEKEELIQMHYKSQFTEVLEQLAKPVSQLDYINYIWEQISEKQVLVKHIELLCKHSPDQVVNFIKSGRYPINESLQLTKQYNIQEGTALLLESQNKIDESISKYLELVDDILKRFLREVLRMPIQINKKRQPIISITTLNDLISTLSQLITCVSSTLDNNHKEKDIDILYFTVFNKIINWQLLLNQTYKVNKQKIEVLTIINFFRQITPSILTKLLYQTDIDLFIDELMNNYSKLNLSFQFYSFKSVFEDFNSHKHILKLGNREIQQTNNMIIDILSYLNNKAKYIEPTCRGCQQIINTINHEEVKQFDQIVTFKCGHSYHESCQKNYLCSYCETDLSVLIYHAHLNLLNKVNKLKCFDYSSKEKNIASLQFTVPPKLSQQQKLTGEQKMKLWRIYDQQTTLI